MLRLYVRLFFLVMTPCNIKYIIGRKMSLDFPHILCYNFVQYKVCTLCTYSLPTLFKEDLRTCTNLKSFFSFG